MNINLKIKCLEAHGIKFNVKRCGDVWVFCEVMGWQNATQWDRAEFLSWLGY
jgi:hypothetical protein